MNRLHCLTVGNVFVRVVLVSKVPSSFLKIVCFREFIGETFQPRHVFTLTSRIEYDAYRVDLEELNLGPRDATTLPKLEEAQKDFQGQRERFQKVRDDLSVKVKLLEENRVRGKGETTPDVTWLILI